MPLSCKECVVVILDVYIYISFHTLVSLKYSSFKMTATKLYRTKLIAKTELPSCRGLICYPRISLNNTSLLEDMIKLEFPETVLMKRHFQIMVPQSVFSVAVKGVQYLINLSLHTIRNLANIIHEHFGS